jgi:hypothetical protein
MPSNVEVWENGQAASQVGANEDAALEAYNDRYSMNCDQSAIWLDGFHGCNRDYAEDLDDAEARMGVKISIG